MGLETGSDISDLVITNPQSSDPKSAGDDHLRLIKTVLKHDLNGFAKGILMYGGTDTGTASANVLTPTAALTAYGAGQMLIYRPANTNVGAVTVNVSGLGAKSIKTLAGADPTAGDLAANRFNVVMYDGTNFVLLAGAEFVSKTGNSTITGNITLTGDMAVSGTLSGPSIDAKGAIAGQTWTGTHNFTGATVTVATPVSGSNPVTKTYADALAFSTALPGQVGNSGKFVTTNGTSASWGYVFADAWVAYSINLSLRGSAYSL